jgi:hypothetical protein
MKPYKDWGAYAKSQYKIPPDSGDNKKPKPEVSAITKFGCLVSVVGMLIALAIGIFLAVDNLLTFIKDMNVILKTGIITILAGVGVTFVGLIIDSIKRKRNV